MLRSLVASMFLILLSYRSQATIVESNQDLQFISTGEMVLRCSGAGTFAALKLSAYAKGISSTSLKKKLKDFAGSSYDEIMEKCTKVKGQVSVSADMGPIGVEGGAELDFSDCKETTSKEAREKFSESFEQAVSELNSYVQIEGMFGAMNIVGGTMQVYAAIAQRLVKTKNGKVVPILEETPIPVTTPNARPLSSEELKTMKELYQGAMMQLMNPGSGNFIDTGAAPAITAM